MEESNEKVNETPETPPVEGATSPQPSRLQAYASQKYPDQQFENDEAIAEALISNSSELEDKYSKAQEVSQKLIDIFESYPEIRGMIGDIILGAKPRAAIAKYFSPEDLTPQEGDDDMEEWNKNVSERQLSLEKDKKFREDLVANQEFSEKEYEDFKKESGLKDEEVQEFLDWCNGLLDDIYAGKVSKVALMALKKGWKHDEEIASAVEKATEIGKIQGKNEKIKTQRDIVGKTDGLPDMTSSGEVKPTPKKEKSYFAQVGDRISQKTILK